MPLGPHAFAVSSNTPLLMPSSQLPRRTLPPPAPLSPQLAPPWGQAQAPVSESAPSAEATLREELSMCDELIELEGECKWVLAASAYIARELGEAGTTGVKCMETLRRIDPLRKRYYEDVSSGAKAETGAAVEAS